SARKRAHSRRRRRIRLATAVPSGVSVTPLYGSYSRNPRPTSFLAISLADTRETSSVSARSGTGTGPAWPSSTARATVIRYISSLSDVAPEAPVGRCWMSGSVSVVMPDSGGWERRLAHRSERKLRQPLGCASVDAHGAASTPAGVRRGGRGEQRRPPR